MAPPLLLDLSQINLDQVVCTAKQIEQVNPHRGQMRLLDGIIWLEENFDSALAYHDVADDEFWVPGHIPGRPIFPGVLMIETAAKLASFLFIKRLGQKCFTGFAGVDKVRFRGQVVPGDRFFLLCQVVNFRPRRSICDVQGIVNSKLVFEGTVTGMPI